MLAVGIYAYGSGIIAAAKPKIVAASDGPAENAAGIDDTVENYPMMDCEPPLLVPVDFVATFLSTTGSIDDYDDVVTDDDFSEMSSGMGELLVRTRRSFDNGEDFEGNIYYIYIF